MNRLTLIKLINSEFSIYQCSCGKIIEKRHHDVNRGFTRSCGCLKSEAVIARNKRNALHGLSHTPTGTSWQAMMSRCYNPGIPQYAPYGGAGIFVCEYLRSSLLNLIETIGPRPLERSIDRINNAGNYTCGKCAECLANSWPLNIRWATRTQQGRNQKTNHNVTIEGETQCLAEWAERANVSYSTMKLRVKRGWQGRQLLLPTGSRVLR